MSLSSIKLGIIMTLFLKIDNIKGNVTAAGYKNCITIHSLQHHISQTVNQTVGEPHNRARDAIEFSDVIVTKDMDNSSILLLTRAYSGQVIPNIECTVVASGDKLSTIAKYKFHQVIISRFATTLGANSMPIETLTLNFTRVETTYFGLDQQHNSPSPSVNGYNLETMELL